MSTASCRRACRCVLTMLVVLSGLVGRAVSAQSPARPLATFVHRAWTVRDGVPQNGRPLAQTDDGILWIGTSAGLYAFDGVRFTRFEPPAGQAMPAQEIETLRAVPGGDLWIGYNIGGASVLHHGRLVSYGARDGLVRGTVQDIARDSTGTIWVGTTRGLTRLVGGRWQVVGADVGYESVGASSLIVDRRGTLWVTADGGDQAVYALPRGSRRFERWLLPRDVGNAGTSFDSVKEAPDGSIWCIAFRRGLVLVADAARRRPADPLRLRAPDLRMVSIDSRGDAWLRGGHGYFARLSLTPARRSDVRGATAPPAAPLAETIALTPSGPLSGVKVLEVIEDREGSVWLATERGLDQFRQSRLTPATWSHRVLQQTVAPGDAGSLWVAGPQDVPFLAVGDRLVMHPEIAGPVTCAYRDHEGGVWLGGPRGLWRTVGGAPFVPVALPKEVRSDVLAIALGRDGVLWVSTMLDGVFRRRAGTWERFGPPRPKARAIVADGNGPVWLGYLDGHVARVSGDTVHTFTQADGVPAGSVLTLSATGHRVWVSGEVGVAVLQANRSGARFVPLTLAAGALRSVLGIVETSGGELWLNGADGVVRVPAAELGRSLRDTTYRAASERFDYHDGLDGQPSSADGLPTAVEGTDGRLWFTAGGTAAWVDPCCIRRNPIPPPVQIRALSADGRTYAAADRLVLPARTGTLRVDYTAASLAVPERVRFRYRLVGLDTAWQDAGARREAFYTSLETSAYGFHVPAANNDGVWAPTGATLDLVTPPTFTQTNAFLALCAAAVGGGVWLLATWRQRRVVVASRARSAAVLAERTRVARELHDTLLNDMAGLAMQLDFATRAPGAAAGVDVSLVTAVRDQARQGLSNARRAVVGLRTASEDLDQLWVQLQSAAQRIFAGTDVCVRVKHRGRARRYDPAVKAEVLRIASEAMLNARRHAAARSVTVTCADGWRALVVRVRDDGRGFDPAAAVPAGGHYGLTGMRERAAAVGARLTVESTPGRGTEVCLVVRR